MGDKSKIEWTDATWNPVRGCTKISAGCKHCYAETFAERFRGVPGHPFEFGFDIRLVPHKLEEPLKWRTPRMVFANSMSDLFHQAVPDEYILRVARVMRDARWHTFQVLTKRADRLHLLLGGVLAPFAKLPNIWWGVSVENRKHGVPRIALLQDAAVLGESPPSHRDERCARLARRRGASNIGNIRATSNAVQTGCSVRRMQADFPHGLPGLRCGSSRSSRCWRTSGS